MRTTVNGWMMAGTLFVPSVTLLAAAEPVVAPDRQAPVLVRALAFDRALPARVGKTVNVGVVFGSPKKESLRYQYEVRQAFQRVQGLQILGRTVRVSVHSYKDGPALAAWIDHEQIGAVYVTSGLRDEIDAIRGVCDEKKLASLAADRALVENGMAIGVVPKGDGLRIVVNRAAAVRAGMDLDSKLLDLAEVLPGDAARP
jgi:uncharacterized protein DUF4154